MNNWIIGFTILLLVTGVTAGIVIGGLNPWINPAEAARIDARTRHKDVMNKLEEQLATAKTEAEIARIKHQQAVEQASYEAELKRYETESLYLAKLDEKKLAAYDSLITLRNTFLSMLGFTLGPACLMLSIAKSIAILHLPSHTSPKREPSVQSLPEIHPVQPLPERIPYDPWHNEEYRQAKIKEARYRERVYRKTTTQNLRDNFPHAAD